MDELKCSNTGCGLQLPHLLPVTVRIRLIRLQVVIVHEARRGQHSHDDDFNDGGRARQSHDEFDDRSPPGVLGQRHGADENLILLLFCNDSQTEYNFCDDRSHGEKSSKAL